MTQYNAFNANWPNSQLNNTRSRIKNDTEVTLKISSNVVGISSDENNFLHKLISTIIMIIIIR